jgi:hypothetical protein
MEKQNGELGFRILIATRMDFAVAFYLDKNIVRFIGNSRII